MIGLILVTHGRLAEEFVAATEHVVGSQRNMHAISIGPDDDIEQRRRDILAAVEAVDDGAGVILLTDMFGGTPSNLAISIMDQGRVEIIAGVNLPMLIKLASVRETESLEEAVASAQEAGRKYINVASTLLNVERSARAQVSVPSAPPDAQGGGPAARSVRAIVTIVNRRGLHARAAAKFVKVAEQFVAEIEVAKDDMVVQRHLDHGADGARGRARLAAGDPGARPRSRAGARRAGRPGRARLR